MYIAKTQKDMLKHDSIPRKLAKNRRCNMFCTHAWFTPATKIHTLSLLRYILTAHTHIGFLCADGRKNARLICMCYSVL